MTKRRNVAENTTTILDLSIDEVSVVEGFIGDSDDIVAFAFTCKNLFESFTAIVKENIPTTITEPWTIRKAIEQFNKYEIKSFDDAQALLNCIKSEDVLERLTTKIKTCEDKFTVQDLIALLSVKYNGFLQLGSFNCNLTKPYTEAVNFKKSSFPKVSGRVLLHLTTSLIHSFEDLVALLRQTRWLQSLKLKKSYYHSSNVSSRIMAENSSVQFDDTSISGKEQVIVPRLRDLECVHIHCPQYFTHKYEYITLFLMAPNLRELVYEYSAERPSSNFLNAISSAAKKLEKLLIMCQTDSEPFDNYIFEDNILKLLRSCTEMKDLRLFHCSFVDGIVLKHLGKHGKNLETFMIDRFDFQGEIDNQVEDLHIGGGVMESMKQFGLFGSWKLDARFFDSMITNMPNLNSLHLHTEPNIRQEYIIRLINHYDFEMLNISLRDTPEEEEEDNTAHDTEPHLVAALMQKKSLSSLIVQSSFSISALEQLKMPQVTYFKGHAEMTLEYIEALHNAFPNLEHIILKNRVTDHTCSLFDSPALWPALTHFLCLTDGGEYVKSFKGRKLKKKDIKKGIHLYYI